MSMSTLGDFDVKRTLEDDDKAAGAGVASQTAFQVLEPQPQYRLYRQRWYGLVSLFFLNLASAAGWSYFGAITIPMTERFGFSNTRVNWLGNIVSVVFLPVALSTPFFVKKFGVRTTSFFSAGCLIISAWLRYAGTADSLGVESRYALMFIAQMLVGIPQAVYQVIGPAFSELWFDLRFRTTATMIIAVSNPLGSGLGQLISPILDDPKDSILLLGIICTVISLLSLLIGRAPPTPPTYAASTPSVGMLPMLRSLIGKQRPGEEVMEPRERSDFFILTFIFGLCVECVSSFSLLSGEMLEPYGYTSDQAGFVGAALLFSGIIAAALTAPILDRFLTHHLNLVLRALVPVLSAGWIGFIFAVKRDAIGGLFVNVIVIGISSLILLPAALEVGVEVTRNADASSAVLWFWANTMNVIFIPIFQRLRAGDDADPPRNHRRGLILNGALMGFCALLVFAIRGRQKRRELDVQMQRERAAQTA